MEFVKNNIYFLLGGVCIIIVGIIFAVSREGAAEIVPLDDGNVIFYAEAAEAVFAYLPSSEIETKTEYIIIHVDGAVYFPGVVTLPAAARVEDALLAAGGATEYANMAGINRAGFLQDGMKIRIPAAGEDSEEVFIFAEGTASAAAPAQSGIRDGLVNINAATSAELQTLPGIGEVRAQSIISFRETHGNFSHIEELMNISGIGPGIMDRVRDRVTVN